MAFKFLFLFTALLSMVRFGYGWRAVPANQARYALRGPIILHSKYGDEYEPRKYLHSVFKFGYCVPEAIVSQNIRKMINLTFVSLFETDVRYIYLLASMKTHRYTVQCLVMKIYTSMKYLFHKSRFPLYYCQGYINLLMLNTLQQIAVHEFYLQSPFRLPATIVFTFYQPYMDIGFYTKTYNRGNILGPLPKRQALTGK